jgi:hypothetical protein
MLMVLLSFYVQGKRTRYEIAPQLLQEFFSFFYDPTESRLYLV